MIHGTADDARLIVGRQPHGLCAVELRVLKRGQSDQAVAQRLRQALEVPRHLLADHAGHEPPEARGVDLVEQRQRHGQREAVDGSGFSLLDDFGPRADLDADVGAELAVQQIEMIYQDLALADNLDVGANVDCSARELVGFARLGSVYARDVLGRERARPPRDRVRGYDAAVARGDDPVGAWFIWFDASTLGVSIFFFISGFLVCRSWDARRHPVVAGVAVEQRARTA